MPKYTTKTYHEEYTREDGTTTVRDVKKTVKISMEDNPFFMTFLKCMRWQWGLKGETSIRVIELMMNSAEYNTGIVDLSTDVREHIRQELGISNPALSRALAELLQSGAIKKMTRRDNITGEIKESKCRYMINPELFWKGELNKREQLIITFQAKYSDDIDTRYSEEDIPPEE